LTIEQVRVGMVDIIGGKHQNRYHHKLT